MQLGGLVQCLFFSTLPSLFLRCKAYPHHMDGERERGVHRNIKKVLTPWTKVGHIRSQIQARKSKLLGRLMIIYKMQRPRQLEFNYHWPNSWATKVRPTKLSTLLIAGSRELRRRFSSDTRDHWFTFTTERDKLQR